MGEGGGGRIEFPTIFISSWTIRTSNIMLIAHFLKKKVLCPGRTSRAAQGYGPCFVFMAHVSTSLPTEVANKVRKLIEETKNGKVVSGMAQMIEFLKANGLAREAVIPPSQVGVHMENRDGLGLNPMQTHSLLHDIIEVGFSFALTNPICIEMYGAEQVQMVEFNNKLASQSQGMLPGFKDDEVYMCKYASLAGSHTNAGLRCINAGQYHPIQESKIVSEGRLDLSRVMMVDSTLHDACVHGLRWTVVNAEVAKIVANLRLVYVVEGFFG